MKLKQAILSCGLLAMALFTQLGCGGAGVITGSGTRVYVGTQSPGDVWAWTIENGTFTAVNETLGHTYSGTAQPLASGYLKLVVTGTTDPGVTTGQAAYAIELSGSTLLIKPAGDGTAAPIVASAVGAEPAGPSIAFNWITIPKQGWNPASDESYGTAEFTKGSTDWTGAIEHYMSDGSHSGSGSATFRFEDGRMIIDGGDDVAAWTPSGVLIVDNGPNEGGVIGVRQESTNIDLTDFLSKQFRGFVVMNGQTRGCWARPNGPGALLGGMFEDDAGIESGSDSSDPEDFADITFESQPVAGILRATLHTNGDDHNIIFAVSRVNGKYVCFGLLAGDRGNVVFVQK